MVETTARDSYGRLLAYLAARSADVAGAEEALSDAFLAALEQWPLEGLPEKPEAWLLAAARRRMIDFSRHQQVRDRNQEMLIHAAEQAQLETAKDHPFPDDRLKLLFVCAHPAIDPAARTPLMLQTVLGMEAQEIASAFLCSPIAMSQRLVRTKAKIRSAGIPFLIPSSEELPERLQFVLDAIYAAFNSGWIESGDHPHEGMAREAVWLGRVVVELMPQEPEAQGLLALMLFCQARRRARLDKAGNYVPLPEQDVALWETSMIVEAEHLLALAAEKKSLGRFQLEAAIHSVHCQRAITGETAWPAILVLYQGLLEISPGIGARVGQAVALSHVHGAGAGLKALASLPRELVDNHQPYWAAKAHLLARNQQPEEARQAYLHAIGLSENPAIRHYLINHASIISKICQTPLKSKPWPRGI